MAPTSAAIPARSSSVKPNVSPNCVAELISSFRLTLKESFLFLRGGAAVNRAAILRMRSHRGFGLRECTSSVNGFDHVAAVSSRCRARASARGHARRNGGPPIWLAAWVCGTANDVFFMFPPFCDNFWQAQATVMLTPRLPLYIVAMYVLPDVLCQHGRDTPWVCEPAAEARGGPTGCAAVRRVRFQRPRFLWWTWHDSDAAIYERLGGAPVGSTMWILTYTSLFNLLFRWATRGGTGEARDSRTVRSVVARGWPGMGAVAGTGGGGGRDGASSRGSHPWRCAGCGGLAARSGRCNRRFGAGATPS